MQGIYIIAVILLGILIPQAHVFTFLIRYSLMVMLFFIFLDVEFRQDTLQPLHLKVLLANLLVPLLWFFGLQFFDTQLAAAAFLIAAMPTAGAAPIIAEYLRCRVEMVTASTIITSPVMALALPFLFQLIGSQQVDIPFWDIMLPIFVVVFVPLSLGQIIKQGLPRLAGQILRFKKISFFLFLLNIFLASANATNFIKNDQSTEKSLILLIACAVAGVCLFNFLLGERLGGKAFKMEASLGLGRKNTMFGVWLALTFFNPVIALGPIFYILFQNAYNSYQILQLDLVDKKQ